MRLTIVVSSTQRRGAEVFASHLAESLPSRGWHVDFVALADRPAGVSSSVSADPLSDRPPAELKRLDIGVITSLRSRLRAHQSNVVLANGSSTLQYGVAAVRTLASRRPRLAYSSIGEPLYWARDPRRRFTYRLLLKFVDQVFSVSAGTAQQLTGSLGVPERKLSVLHTGVPERLLAPAPSDSHGGPLRVLYAGSLSDEKDPLAAIAVMARLEAGDPAVLRVAGAGQLQSAVESAVEEAGLGATVELVGSVPDIVPHLQWADALLLTSRTEGLPGVALEAAAAGVPVVAFDVGGVGEAVLDGVTGFLVRAGDIDAAASALSRLAADAPLRESAGQAGRAMVRDRFTLTHAIDRYDRALRGMLQEGKSE